MRGESDVWQAGAERPTGSPPEYAPDEPAWTDPSTGALVWLGVALLLGFAIPILRPAGDAVKAAFVNVEWLQSGDLTWPAQMALVYPCIAGIAVLCLAFAVRGLARSLGLAALGIVMPVMFMVWRDDLDAGVLAGVRDVALLLAYASLALMWSGSAARARGRAPWLASGAAATGAAMYLVLLVLPVLPRELSYLPVICPFMLLGRAASVLSGIGLLLYVGCTMGAAIVCLSGMRQKGARPVWPRRALSLLIAGLIAVPAGFAADYLRTPFVAPAPEHLWMPLAAGVKLACWGWGLFLLLPVGLAGLIARGPSASPARGATGRQASEREAAAATERLTKLKRMFEKGLVSPEEYEAKRREIMSQM